MSGDFAAVDRLFERALDLDPVGREALFAAEGVEDSVRRRVERLLAAAESDDSLALRSGAAWEGRLGAALRRRLEGEDPGPDLPPGATLGACRIVRPLGSGGMADVYLAERSGEEFTQSVAVKVLKRGLDSEEILRRFAQERRILASARHPGLARLLDGGLTSDGRPYLVLEYVEGRPIDEHCDAARLPLPRRIRLFLQVARAVEAAHRSLVVHRDIKPSNVLVTAEGHVKLLDFGIAKLLDDHPDSARAPERTTPFTRLLTPAFASPEQRAGEPVTTASDVYQLGLLLALLLAGGAPPPETPQTPLHRWLRTLPPEEAERIAAARSTPLPRLRRTLSGDLETAVLVALRPEPERRYGSAGALISDLERYLDGRTLAARPDTFAYRLGKLVRRHRGAVATGALAALLLAVTGAGAFVRVTRERDRAEAEARRSAQTTEFLRGLFRVAAPSRSRGEQVTARELLERGAARLGRDPDLPPELRADLLVEVGGVYRELGLFEEAESRLAEAVELRRRSPGPKRLALASALFGLAEARLDLARLDEAERHYGEALALREGALPPGHPDLALAALGLGRLHTARSRFDRAVALQAPALARLEAALGREHEEAGRGSRHLARSLRGLGRPGEARRHLERALAVLEDRLGPEHAAVATTRVELAEALSDLGERAAARRRFEEALPVLERVYGPDHPALAHADAALADILTAPGPQGQDAETAIRHYRRALAIREKAFGPDHPQVADALLGLGRAYPMAGRDGEAREPIERAISILTRHSGAGHIDLSVPLSQLAKLEQRAGRRRAALDLYRRVVELRERHLGPGHDSLILPLFEQAKLHLELGEPGAALPLLRRVLDPRKGDPEAEHGLSFLRVELGRALTDLRRFAEAEAELLPLAEGEEPHSRRRAAEALGDLYEKWGRRQEAGRWREANR